LEQGKILTAILCYAIASTLIFFQHNIQFISKSNVEFKTNAFIVLFAIPISYMYLFAWTAIVKLTGSVWSARFWFFGMSYLVFPILAYFFLKESPFTIKTIICTILSFIIIWVQFKY
jgi:hypothetical protein